MRNLVTIGNKKRYLILIIMIIFLSLGCANVASESDKKKILSALEEKGYIEKGLKYVDKSNIYKYSIDETRVYDHYDVYGKNGKYYSFNFDRIYNQSKSAKECLFIVYVYDDVTLLKDQEVTIYNNETKQNETVIKDVYKTNVYGNVNKYCVNKEESLMGLIEEYVVEEY